MLAAIRTPARRVALSPAPRSASRSVARLRPAFRKYSTESPPNPEPKSGSNTGLYAALGGIAVAGLGYFIYTSSDTAKEAGTAAKSVGQAAKVAANFVPSKEDYQKVKSFS